MVVKARRDVFQAIADPTRREIINLVAQRSTNVNTIAEHFEMSQPAISQHLKILNECGIITIEKVGRERFCTIQPSSLIPAFLWIEQYQKLWQDKLDSFEEYVLKLHAKNKKNKK